MLCISIRIGILNVTFNSHWYTQCYIQFALVYSMLHSIRIGILNVTFNSHWHTQCYIQFALLSERVNYIKSYFILHNALK